MRNRLLTRVIAIALCLCPMLSLAESSADGPDTPVTHSDFALSFTLHPEGFPGSIPLLRDWAAFLSKLSIRGEINTMDFLQPYSRVYFNGGVYVNDKNRIPFVYDGYHSYRYFISPVIRNESMHFQMHNFFQFMLKPYYFMGLPTQYIALFLYPEATYSLAERYYTPIAEALAGEGTRTISYDDLYALAETLDLIVTDDPDYERAAFYFTALLMDAGYTDIVLDKLSDLESLLDFLDPEQGGMEITVSENLETYVLGKTTLFQKEQVGDTITWTLTLPDPEGYLIDCTYQWSTVAEGAALATDLTITLEGEELFSLGIDGTGFPKEGDLKGQGSVAVAMDGVDLPESVKHSFDFQWDVNQSDFPRHLNLNIDWLHPQTSNPALSLRYSADMAMVEESVFVEGSYRQDDFFNLNDSFLEEYKERYAPTLGLALASVAVEMPISVMKSILQFAEETGILSFLGF